MSFDRLRNRIGASLVLIALAGLSFSAPAVAQKGGGTLPPPVPPGTIYFLRFGGDGSGSQWEMKADGGGKVQSVAGQPSHQWHDGSRWFLQNRVVDDVGTSQWFAVDEDGNAVPLTDIPDIRWNGVPPRWAKDDSFFSYTGVVEGEQELIGRLYVVELDWTLGFPVAAAPVVAFEIRRPWLDDWEFQAAWEEVSLNHHDWSPDGTEVALTAWVWGEGWVVNVAAFSEGGVETRRLAKGRNPAWSPDGSRVVFNREQYAGYQSISDLWTIDPDGTGAAQITKYSYSKSGELRQFSPTWSPDGTHLAFTQEVTKGGKTTWSIMRIPAAGGTATNLTGDFGNVIFPRWRP